MMIEHQRAREEGIHPQTVLFRIRSKSQNSRRCSRESTRSKKKSVNTQSYLAPPGTPKMSTGIRVKRSSPKVLFIFKGSTQYSRSQHVSNWFPRTHHNLKERRNKSGKQKRGTDLLALSRKRFKSREKKGNAQVQPYSIDSSITGGSSPKVMFQIEKQKKNGQKRYTLEEIFHRTTDSISGSGVRRGRGSPLGKTIFPTINVIGVKNTDEEI